MIPIAAKYNAQVIALLWGPDGLPRDENERASLAVELCYAMNEGGIENENIFVDPIITPVNIQQPQLMSTLAFTEMLQDIAPGAKSTNGLSNISNGTPWREPLNQVYMIMLERAGMYSCIADYEDQLILDIAAGKRPDLVEVVHKVQDGEITDANEVDGDEAKVFVRAARVILGHALYSDSWMDM
jgi:5-methyltetrahydrofolate corrinoid/iron sulfur protein methyltransferase